MKRSFRKNVGIVIDRNGSVTVKAPYFISEKQIQKLLDQKNALIEKKIKQIKSLPKVPVISEDEKESLRKKAKEYIIPRVAFWSKLTGLKYTGVKITSARGRFGSCSQKGNLCFSLFLMLAEEKEIDYCILHELCHTMEMNHSNRFYSLVSRFMPDYKDRQKKLKAMILPEVQK